MPIYIRKKNVKIFKLYQNWGMTFSLILAYEKKKKVIFIFVFRFTNKQIQKKKRETKIYLCFPFYLLFAKNTKKRDTKIYLRFSFCVLLEKNTEKRKKKIYFRLEDRTFIRIYGSLGERNCSPHIVLKICSVYYFRFSCAFHISNHPL